MKNYDCNAIDADRVKLYLNFLSSIYCTYSHLAERFSELTGNELFEDLSSVIAERVKRSENQLEQLDCIYPLIGQKPDLNQCAGLTQFLEDNFSPIQQLSAPEVLRRSFVLSYLQYSNSILMASFGLIRPGAETIFSARACHLINALFLLAKKENAILFVLN